MPCAMIARGGVVTTWPRRAVAARLPWVPQGVVCLCALHDGGALRALHAPGASAQHLMLWMLCFDLE